MDRFADELPRRRVRRYRRKRGGVRTRCGFDKPPEQRSYLGPFDAAEAVARRIVADDPHHAAIAVLRLQYAINLECQSLYAARPPVASCVFEQILHIDPES